MKLKALIENHDAYSSKAGLKDNLGDGYLLKMNPVYSKIRTSALALGFQFTTGRFFDYETLPLTQLPKILSKRRIPYQDNVHPLREIEKGAPRTFFLNEIPPFKANYLFHEAAHAVAHPHISKIKIKPGNKIFREQSLALHALLEESFANACESLANIYSTTEIHDEFLYKNSYIMEEARERAALKKAVDFFGKRAVFEVLMLSFLHANFLKTKNTAELFSRVLAIVFGKIPKNHNVLKTVFKTGLDLDPEFTVFTNAFCLRLLGIKTRLPELFQYDFLHAFERDALYLSLLKDLSKTID